MAEGVTRPDGCAINAGSASDSSVSGHQKMRAGCDVTVPAEHCSVLLVTVIDVI